MKLSRNRATIMESRMNIRTTPLLMVAILSICAQPAGADEAPLTNARSASIEFWDAFLEQIEVRVAMEEQAAAIVRQKVTSSYPRQSSVEQMVQ